MSERYPVGTYLVMDNPTCPLTRQRVQVLGYVGNGYVLRLLADDEEWEQETEHSQSSVSPCV